MALEVIGAVIILTATMTVATIKLCEAYSLRKKQLTQVGEKANESEL